MASTAKPVLQAITSFTATIDGARFEVRAGDLIDGDHPAVRKWPGYFGPLVVHHRATSAVEQATAAPGEKRGA